MPEAKVTILNETGLHARPASEFLALANKFKCNITLIKGSKTANAKSILNILALGLSKGSEIVIRTEGVDEKEALDVLVDFIHNLKE